MPNSPRAAASIFDLSPIIDLPEFNTENIASIFTQRNYNPPPIDETIEKVDAQKSLLNRSEEFTNISVDSLAECRRKIFEIEQSLSEVKRTLETLESNHRLQTECVSHMPRKKVRIDSTGVSSSDAHFSFANPSLNPSAFLSEQTPIIRMTGSSSLQLQTRYDVLRRKILSSQTVKSIFTTKLSKSIKLFYNYADPNIQKNLSELTLNLLKYMENVQKICDLFSSFAQKIRNEKKEIQKVINSMHSNKKMTRENSSNEIERLANTVKIQSTNHLKKYKISAKNFKKKLKTEHLHYDIEKRYKTLLRSSERFLLESRLTIKNVFIFKKNEISNDDLMKKSLWYKKWATIIEKLCAHWDEFENNLKKYEHVFQDGQSLIQNWEEQTKEFIPPQHQENSTLLPETLEIYDDTDIVSQTDQPKPIFQKLHTAIKKVQISLSSNAAYIGKIINFAKSSGEKIVSNEEFIVTIKTTETEVKDKLNSIKTILNSEEISAQQSLIFEIIQKIEKALEKFSLFGGASVSTSSVFAEVFRLGRHQWSLDQTNLINLSTDLLEAIENEFQTNSVISFEKKSETPSEKVNLLD